MTVKGKTLIVHKARIRLNLSIVDYCVIDFIYQTQINFPEKKITSQDVYEALGMRKNEFDMRAAILWQKRYLILESEKWIVGPAWEKEFDADIEQSFESFWKIRPNGNKQKAKKAYAKAIKVLNAEELSMQYRNYLAWIDSIDRTQLDTSTWLNPDNGWLVQAYKVPELNMPVTINPGSTVGFFEGKKI